MKRVFPYLIFVSICVICAYPLFHNLGKLTLRMWDESRIAVNAIQMSENHNFLVPYYENKPDMWNTKPLMLTWSIVASTKIFGQNEFGVRFPSAISAFILVISLFLFFRFYLKDIVGAIISSLAIVSFYGFVDYHVARNADFDCMLTFFTFLATTCLYIGFNENKNKWTLLGGVFLCIGFLTKGIAAGILLPGAFIYFASTKEGFLKLFKNKIVLYVSLAISFSFLYYFLREKVNEGFLLNVYRNEITGRYLKSAEGHSETFSFYFNFLYERGIDGWVYILLASIILVFFNESNRQRNFAKYTLCISILFLIVHSFSNTKLPWYVAPLYPHIAIIIGIGISSIVQKIKKIAPILSRSQYSNLIIIIPFFVFYFNTPYKNINNSSVSANREGTYPELFFGNRIADYFSKSKAEKIISVIHENYNSSLEYYYLKYNLEGYEITKKYYKDNFIPNEVLLICEPNVIKAINDLYTFKYIINENNYWVIKITKFNEVPVSDSEITEGKKLLNSKMDEIKNTPTWINSIKEKAKKNNLSIEDQIKQDAIWIIENDKKIKPKVANYLRNN